MNLKMPLLAIAITSLAGCASLESSVYSGYAAAPMDSSALRPYTALVAALQKGPDNPGGWIEPACFASPVVDATGCRVARNQAVAVLAIASADLCLKHRQSIYGRDASANVALGTFTNLFAGAAAVAGTEAAKTLYAALALFSNSERSLVNETVYKQMIVTAVDQKIVDTMDAKGLALDEALKKGMDEFGMHQALRQVADLHASCSFMTGLRLALSEGTRASNTKKTLGLRQNLASARTDMGLACMPSTAAAASAAGTVQCDAAKQRYQAISTSLQAAEVAVE